MTRTTRPNLVVDLAVDGEKQKAAGKIAQFGTYSELYSWYSCCMEMFRVSLLRLCCNTFVEN